MDHEPRAGRTKGQVWGFDSEFMKSGKAGSPGDVHSVQFSDGTQQNTVVLETAAHLKKWIRNHGRVKVVYGFVILPDLGSVEEWLGKSKKGALSCVVEEAIKRWLRSK